MVRKLSALARLTCLATVAACAVATGCSSTAPESESTDAGADGARTRPTPLPEDAGPQVCPKTDKIAANDLLWKAPNAPRSDCSVADYAALRAFLDANPGATVSQVGSFLKGRSAECYGCVFTDANGAGWGPIPVSAGQLVTINIGACFAIRGGRESLGKNIQNLFDCELIACADCATEAEFDSCRNKADKGACADILATAQKDFATAPSSLLDECGSFIDSVRVQCVPGLADGGADGGDAGDAGDAGGDAGDASDDADAGDMDAADADGG